MKYAKRGSAKEARQIAHKKKNVCFNNIVTGQIVEAIHQGVRGKYLAIPYIDMKGIFREMKFDILDMAKATYKLRKKHDN